MGLRRMLLLSGVGEDSTEAVFEMGAILMVQGPWHVVKNKIFVDTGSIYSMPLVLS